MRIAMVAARYFPFMGGIETHIHEVGTRMAASGHQVTVLTTDPSGELPPDETHDSGLQVIRVKAWPKNRDYYFAPHLARHIHNQDIVHVQGYSTFAAPIGMWTASRRPIPFVLTFHSGGHSSWLRNSIRGVQHTLLTPLVARASGLIGVSEFEADFFAERMKLDRRRFFVIPNGAELPAPSNPPPTVDPHLILSIGRLERYKGHHRAIMALPEVLRRVPTASLKIVGSGPYRAKLVKLVEKLGLQWKVSFVSFPASERQKFTDLLCSAGLVVLLSDYEAHPVSVMEALSVGRPVVVTHTSGLMELAQKAWCRSVSLNETPNIIGEIIAIELKRPHNQAPAIKLPNWDDCTRNILGVYAGILNKKAMPQGRQQGIAA